MNAFLAVGMPVQDCRVSWKALQPGDEYCTEVADPSKYALLLLLTIIPFPLLHFEFDHKNKRINDDRGKCAQCTHSKHSAPKEMIKNDHVYLLHSSKYVDETVVYGELNTYCLNYCVLY